MKSNSTIEERAEAHLNGRKPIIESFASQEKLSNDAKRSILFHCFKDYYLGATEQKAIDDDHLREVKKMLIDRACKWLDWKTSGRLGISFIEQFRKAMEEDKYYEQCVMEE